MIIPVTSGTARIGRCLRRPAARLSRIRAAIDRPWEPESVTIP
jgi:hypothetical protein